MLHGLMLLCLLMFLSSCSSDKEIKYIKLSPPEVYLQEVKAKPCQNNVNADLLKCLLNTKQALKRANDDKARIVQWVAQ